MRTWRLAIRVVVLGLLLLWHGLRWLAGWLALLLALRGRDRRRAWLASCIPLLFRDLGATFVKLAQLMSTRADLFPPYLLAALERLQDQVGPFPAAHVRRTLEEDFGAPPEALFAELGLEPIASASIAQVHRGRLHDGRLVAVKVRRPHLCERVGLDLGLLRLGARVLALVPSLRPLDPVGVADELARAVHAQLDFTVEAENNRRFRAAFAGSDEVTFPALVPELCSARVLTMDFIDGVKILRCRERRHDPARLARVGLRVLLKMIFEDGLVHADLHPGNILVTADGRLALVDLGLVAELDETRRVQLARLLGAIARGDARRVGDLLLGMASGRTDPDPAAFVAELDAVLRRHRGRPLGQLSLAEALTDLLPILRRHRVRMDATFTMVHVALAVTEGLGRQLDPTLDLAAETLPYFVRQPTETWVN
jgi:ubiquinone biosynthesis protein